MQAIKACIFFICREDGKTFYVIDLFAYDKYIPLLTFQIFALQKKTPYRLPGNSFTFAKKI
jgi:hypothetical protein